jgi:uncharacterized protein
MEVAMSVIVSSLAIYPIKSLAPVYLPEMHITRFGPDLDRRFMLVDKQNKFYTQRQNARLTQFSVRLLGDVIEVLAPDGECCHIPCNVRVAEHVSHVRIWDDEVAAVVLPEHINAWFSDKLGSELRLVYMPDDTRRQVDLQYAQQGDVTSFNDGFPALLLSEASVTALAAELSFPLSPERFRPNILLSGCGAFAEDDWQSVAIGGVPFDIVKPCSRCVIPTLDLNSGEKQPEVMQVLLRQRKVGNKVYVGQNLIHRGTGVVRVGDAVNFVPQSK